MINIVFLIKRATLAAPLLMAYLTPIHLLGMEHLSLPRKVELLENFLERSLESLEELKTILPEAWVTDENELLEEKSKVESELQDLRSNASQSSTKALEERFLLLKLQWLSLSDDQRKELLNVTESNEKAARNSRLGLDAQSNAEKQIVASVNREIEISKDLETVDTTRKELILQTNLDLEKWLQDVNRTQKSLADARQRFSQRVREWTEFKTNLLHFIEDESINDSESTIAHYRDQIQARLRDSNQRVWNKAAFEDNALPANENIPAQMPESGFQVRENDDKKTREYIESIYAKRLEISELRQVNASTYKELFLEQMMWERTYRSELLQIRGKLLGVLGTSANESPKTYWLEAQTIGAVTSFWMWSWPLKISSAANSTVEKTWTRISQITSGLKLLILLSIMIFLLVKRSKLLEYLRNKTYSRIKTIKRRRLADRAFEIIRSLYTFGVLLVSGSLLIEFIAELGLPEALYLEPHLHAILIFFFVWGVIDLVAPILSQRKNITTGREAETHAIEETFQFFPKLALIYWLIHSLSTRLLDQFLAKNFSGPLLSEIIFLSVFPVIFIGIWLNRDSWRLVSKRATRSDYWHKIVDSSKGRIWEPVVLVFGGGLGVYFIGWQLIKGRVGQLELAKSFQAMLSRALLERKKRKNLFRLRADQYPPSYLDRFNYENEVRNEWYVDRGKPQASLDVAYDRWRDDKAGTSVLILGDRGVGKSALLQNFIQRRGLKAKVAKLRPGDTSILHVCRDLSEAILHRPFEGDGDALVKDILDAEPNIICLENLENCILRQIDGFKTFSFLLELILKTSGKHLWFVTLTPYAWSITKRAVPGSDCFSHKIYVPGMGENEIQDLIMKRHTEASSLRLDFSDLSFDQAKAKSSLSDMEAEEKRRSLYFRILWDYTYGNPRQALYFWKTSLSWNNDRARILLFDVPESGVLEQISTQSLMLLAAIVEHNGLTLNGLQSVLNETEASIRRWIEEISAYEILYSFGEPGIDEGWHIESFWIAAVEAYLEKRMLLFRGGLK